MSHSTVFNKKKNKIKTPAQIICKISQVYIYFDLHASLKGLNHKIKTDINMMSLQNQDRYKYDVTTKLGQIYKYIVHEQI